MWPIAARSDPLKLHQCRSPVARDEDCSPSIISTLKVQAKHFPINRIAMIGLSVSQGKHKDLPLFKRGQLSELKTGQVWKQLHFYHRRADLIHKVFINLRNHSVPPHSTNRQAEILLSLQKRPDITFNKHQIRLPSLLNPSSIVKPKAIRNQRSSTPLTHQRPECRLYAP